MITTEAHFCLRCGAALQEAVHFERVRSACPRCGWIFFSDPKVAAAVVVEKEGMVLLARRAVDPQKGRWTLPAGFVDAGEDPAVAAVRECLEETGLNVCVTELVDVIAHQEHPRGAHILIVYRANILSGDLAPGDDVDEVAFFPLDELPPLAFSSTESLLSP